MQKDEIKKRIEQGNYRVSNRLLELKIIKRFGDRLTALEIMPPEYLTDRDRKDMQQIKTIRNVLSR